MKCARPSGRMLIGAACKLRAREGQAVTRRRPPRRRIRQLARAIVEFSIRTAPPEDRAAGRDDSAARWSPCGISCRTAQNTAFLRWNHSFAVRYVIPAAGHLLRGLKAGFTPAPNARSSAHGSEGRPVQSMSRKLASTPTGRGLLVPGADRALFDKHGNGSPCYGNETMMLIHTPPVHQLQASERTHKAIFEQHPLMPPFFCWTPLSSPSSTATPLPVSHRNGAGVGKRNRRVRYLDLFSPESASSTLPSCGFHRLFPRDEHQGRRHALRGHPFRSAMIQNRRQSASFCATDVTERIEMEQKFIQAGKSDARRNGDRGLKESSRLPSSRARQSSAFLCNTPPQREPIGAGDASELSVEILGVAVVDRAKDIINIHARSAANPILLLDGHGVVAQARDSFGRQLVVHGITLEPPSPRPLPPSRYPQPSGNR